MPTKMPENWLSYACLYTNCHIAIRPKKNFLLTIKLPSDDAILKSGPSSAQTKCSKVKVLPSSHHLFACSWINGHNSTILTPINFYLTPFYPSCVSDSDGIWRNHVTQNGCQEQVLHGLDTTTTQYMRFITSWYTDSIVLPHYYWWICNTLYHFIIKPGVRQPQAGVHLVS